MTGACDLFLPPPSFCASIMACLFCSASSNFFFFSSAGINHWALISLLAATLLLCFHHGLSLLFCLFQLFLLFFCLPGFLFDFLFLFLLLLGKFLFLLCSNFLPLCLFVLQSFKFFLLLCPLFPPLVDVFLELVVEFAFAGASLGFGEGIISPLGSLGGDLLLRVFVVGHFVTAGLLWLNPPPRSVSSSPCL